MTKQEEEVLADFEQVAALGEVVRAEYDRALALIERGKAARRLREAQATMRAALAANTRSALHRGQQQLERTLNAALGLTDTL